MYWIALRWKYALATLWPEPSPDFARPTRCPFSIWFRRFPYGALITKRGWSVDVPPTRSCGHAVLARGGCGPADEALAEGER